MAVYLCCVIKENEGQFMQICSSIATEKCTSLQNSCLVSIIYKNVVKSSLTNIPLDEWDTIPTSPPSN